MMMLWRRWKRAAGNDFQHGKIVSDAFAEQLRREGSLPSSNVTVIE
jgi:hypothetical protein